MADQAIKWLDNWKGLRDVPFFMYYTPGAVHAPIQVPKAWRDKYKGQFDDGWHAYRAQQLERQKKLGLVPEECPRWWTGRKSFPKWDSFSEEGKRSICHGRWRSMPLFWNMSIFISDGSSTISRKMGELDNTLVIYLTADNGCTAEGTPTGTFSELLMQNGFPPLTMEQQLEKLEAFGGMDAWGGPHMANHYSVAWAYASSTPFQWTKQMASHFGGTMSATAMRYPKGHQGQGRMAKTISERHRYRSHDSGSDRRSGTRLPLTDRRRKAYPGKSLTYAWERSRMPKPTIPPSILKCWASWVLYHDGWTISGKPYRIPWST
jgi:arylsulfatase A-like enzyme